MRPATAEERAWLEPKDKPKSAKKKVAEKVRGSAVLSECGRYRYLLTRSWGGSPPGKQVTWLMLNPSTADETVNDQTIRKCMGFARHWGYSGIQVVNLFALRARNPLDLLKAEDPVGPEFDFYFRKALAETGALIAGWGCASTLQKSPLLVARPKIVIARIHQVKPWLPIECLGVTPTGTPRHPLMLSYQRKRVPFYLDISDIKKARDARIATAAKGAK